MLERLSELVKQRADFAFESTFSGRGMLELTRRCRKSDYEMHLVYLWLATPELALARVGQRLLAGGHDIPERVVRRRWARSLVNLFDRYIPLSDSWSIVDTSSSGSAAVIAQGRAKQPPEILDHQRWRAIQNQLRALKGETGSV